MGESKDGKAGDVNVKVDQPKPAAQPAPATQPGDVTVNVDNKGTGKSS